jgi:hypothetical protein
MSTSLESKRIALIRLSDWPLPMLRVALEGNCDLAIRLLALFGQGIDLSGTLQRLSRD